MGRKRLIQLAICVFCMAWLGAAAVQAQDSQNLEERVKQLEQQLTELKAVLQEQKAAEAEKAEAAPAPAKSGEMKLLGEGTLKAGGDIRLRGLFFENLWDYSNGSDSDQREVFRFRPRVYFDWKPADNTEAYVRFTKEWFYGQDEEMPGYDVEAKDPQIDNAWFQLTDFLNTGVTLKAGRQDLIYGEGFVLLDGTPMDGSQTISFDAVKMTYPHAYGSVDVLYSKLHENDFAAADDEDLYGIYNKLKFGATGLEPYILYRNKNLDGLAGFNPPDVFDPSPEEQTLLLGMRATHSFELGDGVKLALAAEGGKEWGEMDFTGTNALPASLQFNRFAGDDSVDRDAWAGLLNATLSFDNVAWKPSIKGSVAYYSGDDPSSADYEGWDDFYGQWPKYSELYIYSLYDGFKGRNGANDADVGAWSNMLIPEVMLTVHPTDRWTQSLRYLYFNAPEDNGVGNGHERGHNLQWLSNYVFTKNLSGHFLAEWFDPGDYYSAGADDAFFVRFQLMYKF